MACVLTHHAVAARALEHPEAGIQLLKEGSVQPGLRHHYPLGPNLPAPTQVVEQLVALHVSCCHWLQNRLQSQLLLASQALTELACLPSADCSRVTASEACSAQLLSDLASHWPCEQGARREQTGCL